MSPDRRFFEVLTVNENGSLDIGSELTPEVAAKGRAGLPPETRKEIGKNLLEKNVFKSNDTHEEAREIVENL